MKKKIVWTDIKCGRFGRCDAVIGRISGTWILVDSTLVSRTHIKIHCPKCPTIRRLKIKTKLDFLKELSEQELERLLGEFDDDEAPYYGTPFEFLPTGS